MSDQIDCPRCGAKITVQYHIGEETQGPRIPAIPEGYALLKERDGKMIPASSQYCAAGDKEWAPLGFRTWPKDNLVYIIKEGD